MPSQDSGRTALALIDITAATGPNIVRSAISSVALANPTSAPKRSLPHADSTHRSDPRRSQRSRECRHPHHPDRRTRHQRGIAAAPFRPRELSGVDGQGIQTGILLRRQRNLHRRGCARLIVSNEGPQQNSDRHGQHPFDYFLGERLGTSRRNYAQERAVAQRTQTTRGLQTLVASLWADIQFCLQAKAKLT
jgi:hypothetical protein